MVQRQPTYQSGYSNLLPVISQDAEVNPGDTNIGTEDIIEEDTGLTQQISTINPSPTLREVPGTDQQGTNNSPWLDEDKVSNPEYPEQQNDSDNNPGDSNTTDDPEVFQSHNPDNPEEPNDTGYPDTLDISTGTA